jgi:outer membrane protein assembly factor BamB
VSEGSAPTDGSDAPGPAPRARRRLRALPVGIVVGAAAISTVGIAWATGLPPLRTTSTTRFLPADGSVTREALVNDAGPGVIVSEHARQRGAQALVTLPSTYAVAVITAAETLDIPIEQISVWRVTSRLVRDGVAADPTTAIYLDSAAGIHHVGAYGGSFPTVYDPPLLTMPADPEVGTTWSGVGDGLPGSILTYDSNGEVTAVDDDCVTIEVSLRLDLDGALLSRADSTEQWCSGSASVSATATYTFESTSEDITLRLDDTAELPSVVGDPAAAPDDPPSTSAVDTWGLRDVSRQLVDDFFGPQDIGGTVGAIPAALPDGRLLVPYSSGDDVVSYASGGAGLVEQWRAHPGDGVLTLAGVGDLIVTTTTGRRVVAHDAAGVQRWAGRTDDLVLAPAIGTPAGSAVTVGLDGAVTAWDAPTGQTLWVADLVTDADLPAVVVDRLEGDPALDHVVLATDRSGTLIALDPADGSVLWETSDTPLDVLAPGPDGSVIAVSDDGRVSLLDATTGDRRWRSRIGGFASSAHVIDDLTIVAGDRELVAFDGEGGRVWSSSAVDQAVTVGDTIVALRGETLTALDADGEVIETWDIDSDEVGTTHRLTVGAQGVWIVGSTSSIRLLGAVTP